jgi:hypothetical protein
MSRRTRQDHQKPGVRPQIGEIVNSCDVADQTNLLALNAARRLVPETGRACRCYDEYELAERTSGATGDPRDHTCDAIGDEERCCIHGRGERRRTGYAKLPNQVRPKDILHRLISDVGSPRLYVERNSNYKRKSRASVISRSCRNLERSGKRGGIGQAWWSVKGLQEIIGNSDCSFCLWQSQVMVNRSAAHSLACGFNFCLRAYPSFLASRRLPGQPDTGSNEYLG